MDDHGTTGGRPVSRRCRRAFFVPLAGLAIATMIGAGPLTAGQRSAETVRPSAHATPAAETVPPSGHLTLAASNTPGSGLADVVARIDAAGRTGPFRAEYGVAVLDRKTGGLTLGAEGDVAFFSASVVKLFTATAILHRVESGDAQLSPTQRTQIQRALAVSDNAAMNALWTAFGGPSTVTDMVQLAGLHETRPPDTPGEWGETRMSPRDVVAVYQYVLTQLSQPNRDFVLNSLTTPGTAGAGDFNQSFGLLRTPGLAGAAGKQGWMIDRGHLYMHSTGVLGPGHRYVMVVLSKHLASVGYPEGRQRLDSAVWAMAGVLGLLGAVDEPRNAL